MLNNWIYYRNGTLKKTAEEVALELDIPVFILNFFEEGRLKQSSAIELSHKISEKFNVDKNMFDYYLNKNVNSAPETGIPITIKYHKNLNKAPSLGELFGQHLEPAGEYISFHEPGSLENLDNYEYGEITFQNPLVIPFSSEDFPVGGNQFGWKSFLFHEYGKIGKELSSHLLNLGYDAIITLGAFGENSVSEIVNLAGRKH